MLEVLVSSVGRDLATADVQLQIVPVSKLRDELLVSLGFDSAQLVIEVDHAEHDTEFLPQLQHDAQQSDRIGPARDRDSYPLAGVEKILAADVVENALNHLFHASIVHPRRVAAMYRSMPNWSRAGWAPPWC